MNTGSIWVIFESNHERNRVCQELMKKAKELAKAQNTKAVAIIINKEQDTLVEQAKQCGADEVIAVKQESHFETDAYIVSKLIEKYQPKII